jgi:adenine phosphoribosyltransferase
VETKKNVLIVTDGKESCRKMAESIAKSLKSARVVSTIAPDLMGTDILPAEVYFFGCEEPNPDSFAYLETVLKHINLVGRPCGVFSPADESAVDYLANMVHDSEVALYHKPLYAKNIDNNVKQWTDHVMTKGRGFNLDDYIRKVPDFPKEGILFYDITSILANPKAFDYCINAMVEIYQDKGIDAVAAIEARGFLFAAPFADRMGIPLILIRKKGKLPGKTLSMSFNLEYGVSEIEIHPDDVPIGKQVLLMDDLIATGGTLNAAYKLLTDVGAIVPEIFGIVGLPFFHYEQSLPNIPIRTLIQYDKE